MHTITTSVEVDDEEYAAIERLAASNKKDTPADYLAFVLKNAAASWAAQLRTPEAQMQLQLAEKEREIETLRAERDALAAENEAQIAELRTFTEARVADALEPKA